MPVMDTHSHLFPQDDIQCVETVNKQKEELMEEQGEEEGGKQ